MSAESRRVLYEARKAARVVVDGRWVHPDAPHGTTTGYRAFSCRCEPCLDATAAYNWAWSRGIVPPRPPAQPASTPLTVAERRTAVAVLFGLIDPHEENNRV